MSVERKVAIEKESATDLLKSLSDELGCDADLMAATIEGETGLFEAIGRAVDEIDQIEVLIVGLKAKEKAFIDRRRRLEAKKDRIRAQIEQAMDATEQKAVTLPTATLSLREVKPGLIVSEEADIPARFWKAQPPKLDKTALLAELKAGEQVPGAGLDNGGFAVAIRRA